MVQARRHHYVSQFYLKNFTENRNKPRLFVVDIPERKSFRSKPQNVAFENDFHTISALGQRSDAVETALARVESEVAPALARIIEDRSLSNREHANHLFFFVAMLLVKNPAQRNTFDEISNKLMRHIGKMQASDKQSFEATVKEQIANGEMPANTDIEGLRQALLGDDYSLELSTDAHLDMELSNIPELLPLLANRQWSVYHAKEGQFVTCDRPTVLMWTDPMRNGPIGLALADTRVLFTLSSEVAISGTFEGEDCSAEIDSDAVASINGQIILNANRQVYARDADFNYRLQHNGGATAGRDLQNDALVKTMARS